jgi:hypothetical protein
MVLEILLQSVLSSVCTNLLENVILQFPFDDTVRFNTGNTGKQAPATKIQC